MRRLRVVRDAGPRLRLAETVLAGLAVAFLLWAAARAWMHAGG